MSPGHREASQMHRRDPRHSRGAALLDPCAVCFCSRKTGSGLQSRSPCSGSLPTVHSGARPLGAGGRRTGGKRAVPGPRSGEQNSGTPGGSLCPDYSVLGGRILPAHVRASASSLDSEVACYSLRVHSAQNCALSPPLSSFFLLSSPPTVLLTPYCPRHPPSSSSPHPPCPPSSSSPTMRRCQDRVRGC